MGIVERIDDMGKPAWIGLMVLSFVLFWPAGLAVLAFLIGSGRMGCRGNRRGWGRDDERRGGEHRHGMQGMARSWWGGGRARSSGNRAFDEYRDETLRRLEEEQKEFRDFLDRLRHARDKAEFDEFLSSRRNRGSQGEAPQPA